MRIARQSFAASRDRGASGRRSCFYAFTGAVFRLRPRRRDSAGSGDLPGLSSRTSRPQRLHRDENKKLDTQIKEIATLRQEIDGLRARQKAVEDLQADRNDPVYLLDELAKQTPEGIYLRLVKQEGRKVTIIGWAASNERVSEFLRNLQNNSRVLERPELIEIRIAGGSPATIQRRLFDFALNFTDESDAGAHATAATGERAAGPVPANPAAARSAGAKK